MAYWNTYFRIKSRYQPYGGWDSDEDQSAFQREARKILQREGWAIHPSEYGGRDSATKGLQDLYLHPQNFSGIIAEDEMPALQEAFSKAQIFQCYHVDVFCADSLCD